jgi:hypothetical protein
MNTVPSVVPERKVSFDNIKTVVHGSTIDEKNECILF